MKIPNIMDSTVPIGKDDSENVEIKVYGEQNEKEEEFLTFEEWLEEENK